MAEARFLISQLKIIGRKDREKEGGSEGGRYAIQAIAEFAILPVGKE